MLCGPCGLNMHEGGRALWIVVSVATATVWLGTLTLIAECFAVVHGIVCSFQDTLKRGVHPGLP